MEQEAQESVIWDNISGLHGRKAATIFQLPISSGEDL
jgi:hypothetical protein